MKILSLARDLQRRKARERQQRFVAEGVRAVEALLGSAIVVDGLLVSATFGDAPREAALLASSEARGLPVTRVTDEAFASASDTQAPQGVLAVAAIPVWQAPGLFAEAPARLLVLDALQDPGNVGTVIRTAAALGVTATMALPGTADLWNAKVVRGAMGALFVHPVFQWSWDEVAAYMAQQEVPLWAASLDGESVATVGSAALPSRLALVVGNEGAGLTAPVAAAVARRVRIPMAPSVESLNVAAATAILLWALRPASHV